MKNPCKKCDYYHPENNTCQSKKVATMSTGHVTLKDRMFCKPYITPKDQHKIWMENK